MSKTLWKLTSVGRKRAANIYSKEVGDPVIDYLYQNKTSSVEELSTVTGKTEGEVRSYLGKLESMGIAESLGGL